MAGRVPFVADIACAVAEHYGVAVDDLKSPSRSRAHTEPRQVAMTLAFRLTDHSKAWISRFFGKHSNTSFWAIKAVALRQQASSVTRRDLRDITLALVRGDAL